MRLFPQSASLEANHTWYQKEEIANTCTHFTAFFMALIGFYFLLIRAHHTGSSRIFIASLIYAVSVTLTFLASSVYHFSKSPRYKNFFHLCDHMAIYVMIAGTYTPFALVTLDGAVGWVLFIAIWSFTLLGFIFKLFFMGRFRVFSAATYIMMGWIGVLAIVPIFNALPSDGLFWLILGGSLYTIGVVFFMMQTIPFAHTIWHLFVMGGALAHFLCIYQYVVVR